MLILILINPAKQFEKAKDAQRKQDLRQIINTLDIYRMDNNCYPASLPFGSEWAKGPMVYMKKTPQDPDCDKGGFCYVYQVDASDMCPQWYTLFGKFSDDEQAASYGGCPLEMVENCLPPGYGESGYSWCGVSQGVDCSYVSTNPLPTPQSSGPTSVPLPTATTVPTEVPTPTPCSKDYACTGGPPARCNIVAVGSGTYCSLNCDGACL